MQGKHFDLGLIPGPGIICELSFFCSLLCSERFFSGYSSFPLFSKTNISKFELYPGMHKHF